MEVTGEVEDVEGVMLRLALPTTPSTHRQILGDLEAPEYIVVCDVAIYNVLVVFNIMYDIVL